MIKALISDIDGTLTDAGRRLSTRAITELRRLIDTGVPIIFASGNTVCFLDAFSHMIGTDGNIIAENGGVYRQGYLGTLHIAGDHALCIEAYQKIVHELQPKGDELRLFSAELRHSDIAFSRDAPVDVIRDIIKDLPVHVIDTGFAIHLQTPGLSKGAAFEKLASSMGLSPKEFLAAGDSENDVSMLKLCGAAIVPSNGSLQAKAVATDVLNEPYGDAIAKALMHYF